MKRMVKTYDAAESVSAARTAQAKFTSKSRENERANSIDDSPALIAQRKKLQRLFGGAIQRQKTEDEALQGKFETVQRVEEEPLQGKFETAQRVEEEEPVQGKFDTVQRVEEEEPHQGKFISSAPVQRKEDAPAKPNNTGLPNNVKNGIESLSGVSMDNVRVHYNSSQPAQLNALAYAQNTDIHVAPGQEQHLPHEAWHVVQQAQGRVRPTMQMKDGVPVNDDKGLEHEADVMGARALQMQVNNAISGHDVSGAGRRVCATEKTTAFPRTPVQRLKVGTVYKSSDNDLYRTRKDADNYVGVKGTAAKPQPAAWITASGNVTSGFHKYTFSSSSFVNDCYKFATKLGFKIAGKTFHARSSNFLNLVIDNIVTTTQFAVVNPPNKDTDTAAADGDFGNFALDNSANPLVGQAYTTVPQSGATITGCNFHVAAVVAKDASDAVTCEADAGDVGRTEPVFDMYSTAPTSRYTFHATYKDSYGGIYAATGVLAPG